MNYLLIIFGGLVGGTLRGIMGPKPRRVQGKYCQEFNYKEKSKSENGR